METLGFHLTIASSFTNAMCWTLIHSVWIGIIVVILAIFGLMATQKASSQTRYWMLVGFMVAFIVATGYAGIREFHSELDHSDQLFVGQYSPGDSLFGKSPLEIREVFLTVIDLNSQWVILIWGVLFFLRLTMISTGLSHIGKIREEGRSLTESTWEPYLGRLVRRLGLSNKIEVLESDRITVPMAFGVLRPVIVVPLGFFMQLPFAQVETILCHELAHIYRRDYLVNLLQSILEAVFFFNPGLWWLSAKIREQREICCDDLVIAHTGQKNDYIKGLLAFDQIENTECHGISVGLKDSKLGIRLNRMIQNRNSPLSPTLKIFAIVCLLALPVVKPMFLPSTQSGTGSGVAISHPYLETPQKHSFDIAPSQEQRGQSSDTPTPSKEEKAALVEDQVLTEDKGNYEGFELASIFFEKSNEDMANREMTVRDSEGNSYYLKISNNLLVGLNINGKVVSDNEIPLHISLLSEIDKAWKKAQEGKQFAKAQLQSKAFLASS